MRCRVLLGIVGYSSFFHVCPCSHTLRCPFLDNDDDRLPNTRLTTQQVASFNRAMWATAPSLQSAGQGGFRQTPPCESVIIIIPSLKLTHTMCFFRMSYHPTENDCVMKIHESQCLLGRDVVVDVVRWTETAPLTVAMKPC